MKFAERVKRWFRKGEQAVKKRIQAERDNERDIIAKYLQDKSHREMAYQILMNRHRK